MANELSAFERVSAVTPLGDGRYACDLDPGWTTLAGINGGMLMAILLRAIDAEIEHGAEDGAGTGDARREVRSLTVHFLRPPAAGPAEVVIEPVRTGARASTFRARLQQDGRTMLEALAVAFTGGIDELARWSPRMPEAGPPRDPATASSEAHPDPRRPALADHIVYTPRIGPRPFSGARLEPGEAARTGGWLKLRDPGPITPSLLALYLDAWWPPSLGPLTEMSLNPTVDLTMHIRTRFPAEGLPPQPLLIESTTSAAGEGFCEEDARIFTADGTLLAQARQMAIMLTPQQRKMVTKDDPLTAA